MKFGPVHIDKALGTTLAHSIKVPQGRLRKGLILTERDLNLLRDVGMQQVIVAQLAPDDVDENDAALRLAQAVVPEPDQAGLLLSTAFTGRVNLISNGVGLVQIDVEAIHALNAVNPMITCATALPMTRVERGNLVATLKIISYAVPLVDLTAACNAAKGAMSLVPVALKTADLIVTDTGAGPNDAKGIQAIKMRLKRLGMQFENLFTVAHDPQTLAAAITASRADLILILTASATSDPNDTAPAALRLAGGQVTRFGLPVDPGNLLFLGEIDAKPVIGLPGCARSPALNGADWVLERVVCNLGMTAQDIAKMGVGGLLKEIPQRPQLRRG